MKTLYLHIPKTGGTSITKALSPQLDNVITEQHPVYKKNPKYHKEYIKVINFKLSRAQHFRTVLGDKPFDKLWKVAIVRNPWDRYVSNWKWLTRKESSYPSKGWGARGWRGEDGQISFESFVKQMSWCYNNQDALHGYQHDKWHIRNQLEHISDDNGDIMMDYIGRFENLNKEFELICKKSELELTLPHLNRVGHYSGETEEHKPISIHYSQYYTQELIDIVAARCAPDIDAFNYDYEEKK